MRLILIPPAFTHYVDNSPFSSIHLCQQIGAALTAKGHIVTIFGLKGSTSELFNVTVVDGDFQPNILGVDNDYLSKDGLENLVSEAVSALNEGAVDAVVNFGHDALPYSIDEPGFLNAVTFSRGVAYDIDYALSVAIESSGDKIRFLSKSQANTYGIETESPLYCPVTIGRDKVVHSISEDLLFAGRVTNSKGISHALNISRRIGKPLSIAGRCDDSSMYQLIEKYDLATYKGCVPRRILYDEMRSASMLIQLQSGSVDEAFGMVTAEALCCGLPVLTWPCGANTEIVIDGEDGIVVPYRDMHAAAGAAKSISKWDSEKRESIKKRALSRFSIDAVSARYESWIEQNTR